MATRRRKRGLVIVGGGGHGLVVAEAARVAGLWPSGFLDDSETAALGDDGGALPRLGALDAFDALGSAVCDGWILGLGDLASRRRIITTLRALEGLALATSAVHPSAWISPAPMAAQIGPGVYVGPRAIVHTRAVVGAHAIINSGAIVEHECLIGENAHIAPGAALGGRVQIRSDTLIGIGARVLPGVRVGAACVVGSGAVVTKDVPDGTVVAGVPARKIRDHAR